MKAHPVADKMARVMTAVLKDDTELFKQFMDNASFRRWMTDTVFGLTYEVSDACLPASQPHPLPAMSG